jgi:acyl-coenzyme A thioesterase PaaI-like protein
VDHARTTIGGESFAVVVPSEAAAARPCRQSEAAWDVLPGGPLSSDDHDAGGLKMGHVPEGWISQPQTAFDVLAGPFYFPADKTTSTCGFLADARHANTRGLVHGGMITTAFDFGLGVTSRNATEQRPGATVQLNIHFIGAMKLSEFAIVRYEIMRATRSLVFLRGVMTVGDRIVATSDGVWKILQ